MRLIRTDAELSIGRHWAAGLCCALFLLGGVGNLQAAAAAKAAPVAAPVNSISVSSAQVGGLRAFPGRLLGVIGSQMTNKAMIVLDGVEQPVLVSQGDLVAGYTVESIEEDTISIKQGDAKEDLFVFKTLKYVASNKSAKIVKDVPTESELAAAKTPKPFKSRVGSRQLASAEPEYEEPVRVSSSRSVVRSSSIKFNHPIRNAGYVSSSFGYRVRPKGQGGYGSKNHKGIDLAVSTGTKVYPAAPGVVKKTGYSWSQGNYVIVSHGGGYETHYYHLNNRRPIVRTGQSVPVNQIIGYSGDTGISTGPHLHFQIEKNGRAVDPADYVTFGGRRSSRR